MQILNRPIDINTGTGGSCNCIVWLDGADITTLKQLSGGIGDVVNFGDQVGYWGDKSGSNRHFTNFLFNSATQTCTYLPATSSVNFTGNSVLSFYSATPINLTQCCTFIVYSMRVMSTNIGIFSWAGTGGDTATYSPLMAGNTTATNVGSFLGSGAAQNGFFQTLSSPSIFIGRATGSNLVNFRNGLTPQTAALTFGGGYGVRCMRLGQGIGNGVTGSSGGYNFLNGFVSEVIVYDGQLTSTEYTRVLNYLTSKWINIHGNENIPRAIFALKSGRWSDVETWSTSAYPLPFSRPLSADIVYTNNFTVTADIDTTISEFRNISLTPNINPGGTYVLPPSGVYLKGNIADPFTNTTLFSSFTSAYSEVIGNVIGGGVSTPVTCFLHVGTGTLALSGNYYVNNGGGNNYNSSLPYIRNPNSTSTIILSTSRITGGSGAGGTNVLLNNGICRIFGLIYPVSQNISSVHNTGFMYVSGMVIGSESNTGIGISNTGVLEVTGTVMPSNLGVGINHTGGTVRITGLCTSINNTPNANPLVAGLNVDGGTAIVRGDVIGGSLQHGIIYNTLTPPLTVVGSLLNHPNGNQAVYSRSLVLLQPTLDIYDLFVSGSASQNQIPRSSTSIFLPITGNFNKVVVGTNYCIAQSANTFRWFGIGNGGFGNFGQGTTNNISIFSPLTGSWSDMYAGYGSVFALSANTTQWFAAGDNSYGQLGMGHSISPITTFTQITGNWTSFAVGSGHVIALSANTNRWFGVGLNTSGQLAQFDLINKTNFSLITGNYIKVGVGSSHTVALSTLNGAVNVWGSNANGQIGLGATVLRSFSATPVIGRFSDISCGNNHTILLSAGTLSSQLLLFSTGRNTEGQLGLSDNTTRFTFTSALQTGWDTVVCGNNNTFVRNVNTGRWSAVGENMDGQLGINIVSNTNTLSSTILEKKLIIVPGNTFTYAIKNILRSTYIRQPRINSSEFVNYLSENTMVDIPSAVDVVGGFTYANQTLTGTMILPSKSTVNAGVPVGIELGEAYLAVEDFWNYPVSGIQTNYNSIGEYLTKTITSNSLSGVLNSLDFSKI